MVFPISWQCGTGRGGGLVNPFGQFGFQKFPIFQRQVVPFPNGGGWYGEEVSGAVETEPNAGQNSLPLLNLGGGVLSTRTQKRELHSQLSTCSVFKHDMAILRQALLTTSNRSSLTASSPPPSKGTYKRDNTSF